VGHVLFLGSSGARAAIAENLKIDAIELVSGVQSAAKVTLN
jgi:hypothetical protein